MDISHNSHSNDVKACTTFLESTSLLEALGGREQFAPEEFAPPVDEDLITEFVQGKLTGDDRVQAIDFISSFENWRKAFQRVVRHFAKLMPHDEA